MFANEGTQAQEFSIDAMQDGFQEVSLPGVFSVKQLQQLQGVKRWEQVKYEQRYLSEKRKKEKQKERQKDMHSAQWLGMSDVSVQISPTHFTWKGEKLQRKESTYF